MSKEIIIHVENRELPRALTHSAEFCELDEIAKLEFASRLRYIEEITIKLSEDIDPTGYINDHKAFIDRIELDLMINLGAHGKDYRGVSTWLLHSSWTFETSVCTMRATLGTEVLALLDRPPISIDATAEEFSIWNSTLGGCLTSLMDKFYLAKSFNEAMGGLVAIDLCLAKLYCGFIAQRLNPRILPT